MASKRRGGFRPPELRGTLGTLLRTTTGVVRDALERGAREGRARLDDARATRRRQDALADLGELVLDLIRRGEIDLAELPEARDLVRVLDDFDAAPTADEPDPEPPRPASRRRFDDRPPRRADAKSDGTVASGAALRAARPTDAKSDGTVASGAALRAARPTVPARPGNAESPTERAPTKPIKGIWRPRAEDAVDFAAPAAPAAPPPAAPTPAAKRSLLPPRDAHRKGGISFDDDDLNEYMHPDDVPAKGAPKDPDDRDA